MVLFKTLWHIIENLKKKSKRNERNFIENGKKEIRCYKQKGAWKPFIVLQRFGQSWMNLMKLADENVKASLLKEVLNLLALNCCKWSVVS